MDLISLLILILVAGLLLYLVESLPIAQPFKLAARVVVVILLIVWLLGYGHPLVLRR